MATNQTTSSRRSTADQALLAACERYMTHKAQAEARFAEWTQQHPDRDLPGREQDAIVRESMRLAAVVRDLPARTLRGARAKARACSEPEYYSAGPGGAPSTVVHALILDLMAGAAA